MQKQVRFLKIKCSGEWKRISVLRGVASFLKCMIKLVMRGDSVVSQTCGQILPLLFYSFGQLHDLPKAVSVQNQDNENIW